MFYVYEWFIKNTNEIFYVGKGCGKRYLVKNRNDIFNKIISENDCDVKIIAYFEKEEDAFNFEEEKIKYLKSLGQAKANKDYGGNGGVSSVWTDEMRKRMSENNPMKDEKQRKRMSEHNPMQNQASVLKMIKSKSKEIVIDGKNYNSVKEASQILKVCPETIYKWISRGYNTEGKSCYYKEKGPKNFNYKKTTSKPLYLDDKYFSSLREACNFLKVKDTSALCRALKNNKPYKGYICKYADQQPS